jgi:putative transposase
MAKRLRVCSDSSTYFLTFVVWKRIPVFEIESCARVVVDTLAFYIEKRSFNLHGYVIMPDHIHLVLTILDGRNPGQIVGPVKSYISHLIGNYQFLRSHGSASELFSPSGFRLWVPRFDEITIRDDSMLVRCLDYVHSNPVKSGLASEASKYPYSSAYNYETGLLRPGDLQIKRI